MARQILYSTMIGFPIRRVGKLHGARQNGRDTCPIIPDRAKDWPMWEKCVGCGEGLFAGDAFCGNCGRPVKPAVPAAREPGGLESGPLTAPAAGRAQVRIIPAHRGDPPGHAAAEQVAADQVAADQAAPEQVARTAGCPRPDCPTGPAAAGQVAPGQVAPTRMPPARMPPARMPPASFPTARHRPGRPAWRGRTRHATTPRHQVRPRPATPPGRHGTTQQTRRQLARHHGPARRRPARQHGPARRNGPCG